MNLITFAGPPSAGKTSVLLRLIDILHLKQLRVGVVKFDCLYAGEGTLFDKRNVPFLLGLSANLCPDHFFVSNIQQARHWALSLNLDFLFTESAGLCNRCAPHVSDVPAVCVIDNLMGMDAPRKVGPMLRLADVVVITKHDIVSQAEREVFAHRIRQANPKARLVFVNGITGQGALELLNILNHLPQVDNLDGKHLRFSMPAALCSYCLGETRIGDDFQVGNLRKMDFFQSQS